MNHWLRQRRKRVIYNVCMACKKKVESWFHGQGFICEQCTKKGITRHNFIPSIKDVFG